MRIDIYYSKSVVTCFDNEPADNTGDHIPDPSVPPRMFSQEEVNSFLAEERRKQQTAQQAALLKTETTYKELLANNQNLSAQDRKNLEENLSIVQAQLRTKDQQAAIEKKQLEDQYKGKLSEAEKRAAHWESVYRESTVDRSLLDAAHKHDAYRPEQIVTLLKGDTKLVDEVDGNGQTVGSKVVVQFMDPDPHTGELIPTMRTPDEAVKRMKELPEIHGNLFKSNVVSGIGANSSANGYPSGSNGKPDLKKLSQDPEQFRKVMKENPNIILNARSNR